jgi:hypothetical protein
LKTSLSFSGSLPNLIGIVKHDHDAGKALFAQVLGERASNKKISRAQSIGATSLPSIIQKN